MTDDQRDAIVTCADRAQDVYVTVLRVIHKKMTEESYSLLPIIMGMGAVLRRLVRASDVSGLPAHVVEFALDVGGRLGDHEPEPTN